MNDNPIWHQQATDQIPTASIANLAIQLPDFILLRRLRSTVCAGPSLGMRCYCLIYRAIRGYGKFTLRCPICRPRLDFPFRSVPHTEPIVCIEPEYTQSRNEYKPTYAFEKMPAFSFNRADRMLSSFNFSSSSFFTRASHRLCRSISFPSSILLLDSTLSASRRLSFIANREDRLRCITASSITCFLTSTCPGKQLCVRQGHKQTG